VLAAVPCGPERAPAHQGRRAEAAREAVLTQQGLLPRRRGVPVARAVPVPQPGLRRAGGHVRGYSSPSHPTKGGGLAGCLPLLTWERSSRLGLAWGNRPCAGRCPQVKRAQSTLSGGGSSGSAGVMARRGLPR
jgi:hypothetical protein